MSPVKPHAVIVPWPAPAHEKPLMSFAKHLHANYDFHITFVRSISLNLRPTTCSTSNHVPESDRSMPNFIFKTIEYGHAALPSSSSSSNPSVGNVVDVPRFCRLSRKHGLRRFKALLGELNSSSSSSSSSSSDSAGVPAVSCVVADGVMGFAVQAAIAIGVPGVSFITSSVFSFAGYLHYRELILRGILSFKPDGTFDSGVGFSDNGQLAELRNLPSFYQTNDPNEIMFRHMLAEVEDCVTSSSALIFNHFNDFELEAIKTVESYYARDIYSIGPLTLLQKKHNVHTTTIVDVPNDELSDHKDPTVFSWLESREPNSVLYVNYGYVALMSDLQFQEMAWGIVNSGHPFLSVIKDGREKTLPDEFALFMDNIKQQQQQQQNRGLIVRQLGRAQEESVAAVLRHPAIGVFLTHCDYNSMTEAICGGVPVICLPLFYVQEGNCHCACSPDIWDIGMKMNPHANRHEVSALVKKMIVGEEGVRKRKKAQEWKLKGESATDVGGSSYKDLHHFIKKTRETKYKIRLYNAAMVGDWSAAERIFEMEPSMLTATLTDNTREDVGALHIAALAGQWEFLEKLVELVPLEALTSRDAVTGSTVLHYAIVGGNTKVVKALVHKNPSLLSISDFTGLMPIGRAAAWPPRDTIEFLLSSPRDVDSASFTADFLNDLVFNGWYDLAMDLLERYPHLGTKWDRFGRTLLDTLMLNQEFSRSVSHLINFWECFIYFWYKPYDITHNALLPRMPWGFKLHDIPLLGLFNLKREGRELKPPYSKQLYPNYHQVVGPKHEPTLAEAARNGRIAVFKKCIQTFPLVIWEIEDEETYRGIYLLQIAVLHRQEKIYKFICGMPTQASVLAVQWTGSSGTTNLLHMVAKLPPSTILNTLPGPALQMQRELQWFEEIKKILPPAYLKIRNEEGETPKLTFSREHKDLMEKGEKWMKDTAQSCMVVATLIATVVFAAIFTVPGGNINDPNGKDNGLPIFLHKDYFILFAVSDAITLFSSLTSVLVFLSILTSRYAEEDFLYSLPRQLIWGLSMLFLSIAATMVTFSAALSIMLSDRVKWIYIPTTLAACVPVAVFVFSHVSLFVQVYNATYRSEVLFRN
ncbi:hypothetical protein Sjap_011856 [Stephania japonica]|uniref:PGG domain-containing protein n=1 Tax=Stephania japonica TaxID=461633 RepID=A0AAP0JC72_9MAGN